MLAKAHRSDRRFSAAVGFTLIELLVAVAVIGVLASVLAPSLGAARRRSQEVCCASRLKQWGLALACYAAENRSIWPHCDGLDRGPRDLNDPRVSPEDVADWFGWIDVLPPLMSLPPWRHYPRGERPNETTFYQCPLGRPVPERGAYNYYPERDGYFSYAMNSCLMLDGNAWPPPGGEGYPMPSFLNTDRIVRPAQVIVLFDQLLDPSKGFDAQQVYRGAGKYSASYPKAFSARHVRGKSELGGNVVYADGHVAWQARVWKPWWPRDLEVPPRDDPDWFPYPAAGATGR